jgi:hypothetical protein
MNLLRRAEADAKKKVCWSCLKFGHMAGDDQCKWKNLSCKTEGCNRVHHPTLCGWKSGRKAEEASVMSSQDGGPEVMALNTSSDVAYGLIEVGVEVGGRLHTAMVMLDSGSNTTFITDAFVKEHKIPMEGEPVPISIQGVGKDKLKIMSRECKLTLRPLQDDEERDPVEIVARTIDKLRMNPMIVNWAEIKKDYSHLRDLPLKPFTRKAPDILLGLDNSHALCPLDGRVAGPGMPYAVLTKLGWVAQGHVKDIGQTVCDRKKVSKAIDRVMSRQMAGFFAMESFGTQRTMPYSDQKRKVKGGEGSKTGRSGIPPATDAGSRGTGQVRVDLPRRSDPQGGSVGATSAEQSICDKFCDTGGVAPQEYM